MEKIFILFVILLSLIFISSFVNAFGYSSSYTVDSPLNVYRGETKYAEIKLRTTPDEGNLTIKAEMLDNAGIAELVDEGLEYEIGPEKDAIVNISLKVPSNSSLGEHSIRMKFTDITPSTGGGMVGFKGGFTISLKANVIEKPLEEETEEERIGLGWIILWIVVVAASTAVIYLIIKIRKKTSEEETV